MLQRLGKAQNCLLLAPWRTRGDEAKEETHQLPERPLLARWGGTAGVVNQAAAVQGPATSQHQGLTITPHIPAGFYVRLE